MSATAHGNGQILKCVAKNNIGIILFCQLSGPYKVNGVPLRRVPQSYVIATKTTVDISKVNLSDKVNDAMFKRSEKVKRSSDAMFEESDAVSTFKSILPRVNMRVS